MCIPTIQLFYFYHHSRADAISWNIFHFQLGSSWITFTNWSLCLSDFTSQLLQNGYMGNLDFQLMFDHRRANPILAAKIQRICYLNPISSKFVLANSPCLKMTSPFLMLKSPVLGLNFDLLAERVKSWVGRIQRRLHALGVSIAKIDRPVRYGLLSAPWTFFFRGWEHGRIWVPVALFCPS